MEIFIYDKGSRNGKDWIKSLDEKSYKKLKRHLITLKNHGHEIYDKKLNVKDIKPLKKTNGLWQIRVDQHRALFYYDDDKIIITSGFTKKEDDTPPKEIRKAQVIKNKLQKRNLGI